MNEQSEAAIKNRTSSTRRRRTLVIGGVLAVLVAIPAGLVALALSDWGDPTAGTMPPEGDGRVLVARLLPVLDDDAAIAELVPADTAEQRATITRFCSELVGTDPVVTIYDAIVPTPFSVSLHTVPEPGVVPHQCALGFSWVKDEGWHVGAEESRLG
ncbi:hypothetical protein GTU73_16670 [Rathayibacter sp. VKM Ac-2804]|uniref:hypothetical protein n=1 Tax=Rathayibacter sp. VKM Ac-2804 TaxID=2609257 RepID=UPI00132EDB9D|nr:hypothetical protein [Rathayibacter sp. VKM Ac-2804]QHF25461.1 hypothetical protein GTU73_16670 [Rathayibacter sp. VKM Ac-2804]